MAISRKLLRNNRLLANNVTIFSQEYLNLRALVLDQELSGLETLSVKDYYNLVILETSSALSSVPEPDFLFWQFDSPYQNGALTFPNLFSLDQTTLITNYETANKMRIINRSIDLLSVNYLPSNELSSTTPNLERKTLSGLSVNDPGVHFALISGCTEIYYTGSSPNATTVTKDDIVNFVGEQDRYFPKNLIQLNRPTVLNQYF